MFRLNTFVQASIRRMAAPFRHPQLLHHRNFSKIELTSPVQVQLLLLTKSILRALLIFSSGMLVICGGLYAGSTLVLKEMPPIAATFTLADQLNTRVAVYYQDYIKDGAIAEMALAKVLKNIALEEGIEIPQSDDSQDKTFKLLDLKQFNSHDKQWQTTYLDLVIRLALVKAELGDLDNAKKLNLYAVNLPMDLGSKDLRSQSLRLQARLCSIEEESKELKHFTLSEDYLLDCVRFNEFYHSDILFQNDKPGSLLIDVAQSNVNNETFRSLLDLGVVYSKQGKYSQALEIFLNLLQVAKETPLKTNAKLKLSFSDIPMLKNYIGEILFKKDLIQKSIEWCKEAAQSSSAFAHSDMQSAIVCKNSLKNLSVLYGKINDEELQKQATEEADKISLDIVNPKKFDILSVIF